MSKFEMSKRKNGEFQFNLKAGNDQVILSSEGYASKSGCEGGIESVKKNAPKEDSYERKMSTNGKYPLTLKPQTDRSSDPAKCTKAHQAAITA